MARITNIDYPDTQNFFKIKSLGNFIYNSLQIILIIGTITSFFFLIWGAIEYIISGGDQERVKTAKSKLTNSIIGLTLLAALWAIWRLLIYFLGLSPTIKGPFEIKLPTLY